jgi:hypothetical protein
VGQFLRLRLTGLIFRPRVFVRGEPDAIDNRPPLAPIIPATYLGRSPASVPVTGTASSTETEALIRIPGGEASVFFLTFQMYAGSMTHPAGRG